MKSLIAMVSLIMIASTALATELNHVSCVYFHRDANWEYYGYQSGEKFDLKEGESRLLVGAWTSERSALPNYAICNEITGTNDKNLVRMRQVKFEGQIIEGVSERCIAKGTDIKQVSEQIRDLARGSYSELVSDWLVSPGPDRINVKTYIPTAEEIDRLNEIAEKKCVGLMP